MSIIGGVDNLAAKEREIRRIQWLIERLSSLSDDDLAKAWPRIIVAQKALGRTSANAEKRHWIKQIDDMLYHRVSSRGSIIRNRI
jgi:hypothetical protein